ncbi:MAG: tRNA pseudouridine(13) synthase TruD [Pseudomonadota bacterium]
MPNVLTHSADLNRLNYAYGQPECLGIYKVLPQDFIVEEQIAYPLSGEGEHLWCWVEKTGENTDWVLQQLAKWAAVSPNKIGVAGQKDRHAVTRQWFSIQLPGLVNPDIDDFKVPNVTILKSVRHHRKLQTGGLSGNRFTVVIRNIQPRAGDKTDIIQSLQARLNLIKEQGVPNYYGEQRFGIHGRNLKQGEKLLAGELPKVKRNQKSLYLSSIRSWMFNTLLSERIQQQNWNQLLPGDVLQLEGSNKWFIEDGSAELAQRVNRLDLHPTGALFGRGNLPTEKSALEIEQSMAERFKTWIAGLDNYGVKQDRRALRLLPLELEWQWIASSAESADALSMAFDKLSPESDWRTTPVLQLSFSLRSGSYATMVMRELLQSQDYHVMLKAAQNPD